MGEVAAEHAAAQSKAAELELRDVSKRYDGQREPAIVDLSLTVPAGEVCVLVGPSGSGKTTAMRLINRMISITSGDILLGGRSVLTRDARELRREIGYVIQQIGLFPHQTVGENIATVPRPAGLAEGAHRSARAGAAGADRPGRAGDGATATRRSCRAGSASASAWRARWRPTRR